MSFPLQLEHSHKINHLCRVQSNCQQVVDQEELKLHDWASWLQSCQISDKGPGMGVKVCQHLRVWMKPDIVKTIQAGTLTVLLNVSGQMCQIVAFVSCRKDMAFGSFTGRILRRAANMRVDGRLFDMYEIL